MILLASSAFANLTMMVDADLVGAFPVSHPMYLISAREMNGRLSYRAWSLFSSNVSTSSELVHIPCARTPYVRIRTVARLLIRWGQSSANCLSASASLLLAVPILRSPLLSWFDDTIFMFTGFSFPFCSRARSTWALRLRGFMAHRFCVVNVFPIFTTTSRCVCVDGTLILCVFCVPVGIDPRAATAA